MNGQRVELVNGVSGGEKGKAAEIEQLFSYFMFKFSD
jgi:hypothetical protein